MARPYTPNPHLAPNPIHKMQLKHHTTTNDLRNPTPPKNVPVGNSCAQPHGTTKLILQSYICEGNQVCRGVPCELYPVEQS